MGTNSQSQAVEAITAEEAFQRMQRGGVVVLDVREPHEFAAGHVPGARNWSLQRLASGEFPEDVRMGTPVLVYCRSGVRSAKAARLMRQRGYRVSDFGGILDWPYAIER